ncbi:MAG: hypothetical protein IPM76_03220 [Chloroflexi bacterium]|nr:hypothetical protein [Chloroflexota bacterium]
MYYGPFLERFPEVAAQETRVITAQGHALPPDGEYGLVELFCTEPGCDCRRGTIVFRHPLEPQKLLATISYGWERRLLCPMVLAQMIRTSSAKCKALT